MAINGQEKKTGTLPEHALDNEEVFVIGHFLASLQERVFTGKIIALTTKSIDLIHTNKNPNNHQVPNQLRRIEPTSIVQAEFSIPTLYGLNGYPLSVELYMPRKRCFSGESLPKLAHHSELLCQLALHIEKEDAIGAAHYISEAISNGWKVSHRWDRRAKMIVLSLTSAAVVTELDIKTILSGDTTPFSRITSIAACQRLVRAGETGKALALIDAVQKALGYYHLLGDVREAINSLDEVSDNRTYNTLKENLAYGGLPTKRFSRGGSAPPLLRSLKLLQRVISTSAVRLIYRIRLPISMKKTLLSLENPSLINTN